ncbi:MAG: hypothetical protein ACR2QM_03420, partial [Longimicrobiales bacterium]
PIAEATEAGGAGEGEVAGVLEGSGADDPPAESPTLPESESPNLGSTGPSTVVDGVPSEGVALQGVESAVDSLTPTATVFSLESDLVTFQSREDATPPETQSLTISGPVAGPMESRVAYSLGQPSGWVDVSLSADRPPADMSLTVDPTLVPAGRHEARVNLSDGTSYLGAVRVVLEKVGGSDPVGEQVPLDSTEAVEPPPSESPRELLDRQMGVLLDGAQPAALAAVRDTAQMVWSSEDDDLVRAQAAFVIAQAEAFAGDPAAAREWGTRAVELAPGNQGYQRFLEDLPGGVP